MAATRKNSGDFYRIPAAGSYLLESFWDSDFSGRMGLLRVRGYGLSVLAFIFLGTFFPDHLQAQTAPVISAPFTSLISFTGTNGEEVHAGLIQGSDGNFYGTTGGGGS